MMDKYSAMGAGELNGFQRRRQMREARVASAVALWGDLLSGRAPSYFLQEALVPRTPMVARAIEANYPGLFRESMTISDFPLLTGDVLDRMMLARYRAFPSPYRRFARVRTNLQDFRTVRRIAVDGAEGRWNEQEKQKELDFTSMSETGYTYSPVKYSRGIKISFEALMNDDLDAFQTAPDRLGRGGARTAAHYATSLYVDSSGPHASLYTGGNGNALSSNPVLSVSSLGTAMETLMGFTDADGEPIFIEEALLVVPPGLWVTANNIMNQLTVDLTTEGGASGQTVRTNNWIVGNLQVVVDPYIPIIATSNGNTSWFVFADPAVGRPALEVGFLTGFAEPQLYQKLANTMRVGGAVDQMAGDFSTMSQEYKGVIAFGGTRLDWRSTVASDGSGS